MSEKPKFKDFSSKPQVANFRALKSISETPNPTNSISSSASISRIPSTTSLASSASTPRIPSSTRKSEKENITKDETSPVKDFQKVPNSVTRDVLAQGIFKGKSKQVWDYLWSVSRAAIHPTRYVRKSRKEIKEGSGLGSMVTVDAAIEHLAQYGLIKVESAIGSLIGNQYEIFTPEEVGLTSTSIASITRISSNTSPIQKLDNLVLPETSNTSATQFIENKVTYDNSNTSLKTNTKNDDEPFGTMIEILSQTGKGRQEDWGELGQLLKMEFDIAASRTKGVTNAPKFLAEHLRRRLMPIKKEAPNTKPNKTSHVGSQQPAQLIEEYQAEPLTKEGRESTLKTFSGYIEKGQKEFLMSLEDTYTKEDWEWLKRELKIE